jgi:nucleoside-diphosphate-sugar epimerase
MKIVIIGGTGFIGSKLAGKLRRDGHDVAPVSPRTGGNTITGEGLAAVLSGAEIVVDVLSVLAPRQNRRSQGAQPPEAGGDRCRVPSRRAVAMLPFCAAPPGEGFKRYIVFGALC